MTKITKEQDKAYKIFTEFLRNVLNHTETLHKSENIFIKDKALKDLSELLYKNYNWTNALSKKDIENIYKQKTN
jgi:hypothetical protein